jgi:hypothetical protein
MDTQKLTIRQRAGRFLLGGEIDRLEESVSILTRAYRRGPYVQTPQMLVSALEEVDSQLVDLLLRQRGYDIILGRGIFDLKFTESDRLNIVDQTRWAFHFDSQAGRAVNAWTDFGFGQRPIVEPADAELAEDFDEFWTAKRNAYVLSPSKMHNLSNAVVHDGELFFIYWIGADGTTTIRWLDTKSINRIEYEKDDTSVPLFYVENRVVTANGNSAISSNKQYSEVWYPDWRATEKQLSKVDLPPQAINAQDLQEHTRVVAQHVAYQIFNGRGWPPIYRALPWYEEYTNGLKSRAAVMQHVSLFPSKAKHKGGSRYTDELKGQLDSTLVSTGYGPDRNPPPAPGATWIENEAITRSRLAMTTGAADGQKDTMLLLAQAVAGDGLPLAFRGRPDAAQNRAVADVTIIPWQEQMDRYAGVWETVYREMAEIVGSAMVAAGRRNYTDFSARVSVSRPTLVDVADVATAMDSIDGAAMNGTLDMNKARQANEALTKLILERYGLNLQEPMKEVESRDEMPPAVDEMIVKLAANEITAQEFASAVWDVLTVGITTGPQLARRLRKERIKL